MTTEVIAPGRLRVVAILLVLWEAMGCYACFTQIKLGAAAMGPVDDRSTKYFGALPFWYNWVYAVATFGGLVGGLALRLRNRFAPLVFWISFAAIILMFGYAFAATDLIAHKSLGQVLPFPLVIAAAGAFSIWFAGFAAQEGWLRRRREDASHASTGRGQRVRMAAGRTAFIGSGVLRRRQKRRALTSERVFDALGVLTDTSYG